MCLNLATSKFGFRRARSANVLRAVFLLLCGSVCYGQSVCPSVNFLVARTVNLKPTATSHINLVQQPLGSYTGYEVTDAAPHRAIAVTPHFEKQFAACLPHDLPSTPAEEQSPVVYTSQLQASVGAPSGELVASIDIKPNTEPSIQLDVFDSQFNLVSETILTAPTAFSGFVSLALVDVNGDRKPDLIALSSALSPDDSSTGSLWIFAGNGDGTFQSGVSYPLPGTFAGASYTSFAVADLNGDGKTDLAMATITGVVTIALGNGDGTFSLLPNTAVPSATFHTFAAGAGSVAAADLNGDGKPDLVFGPFQMLETASGVLVALGNGDGTFQAPAFFSARFADKGFVESQIALGDANQDGIFDIVTSGGTILFGDGKGGFPSRRDYASSGSGAVMLADFDGDGKTDIIIGNGNPTLLSGNSTYPTLTVLFGQGGGVFAGAPIAAAGAGGENEVGQSIAAADFNGDGIPDLAFTDRIQEFLTILKGAGNGDFAQAFRYTFPTGSGLYPVSLAVADFNRDGKPDIAVLVDVSQGTQGEVQIFLGNGDGTLQSPTSLALPAAGVSFLAAADLNGDGIPDLAATAQGAVWVWLGKGDGTFSAPVSYTLQGAYGLPGATLTSLVFGDFNRDGKLDIAVANQSAGKISILLGIGGGAFTTGRAILSGEGDPVSGYQILLSPTTVVAADFNGDGILDLAVSNSSNQDETGAGFAIALGNGDGTFQQPALDPEPALAIAAADINGDKIPDLVVTDQLLGTVVRIGNGDGTFQPATPIVSTPLQEFAIADFNRDGTLDIAGGVLPSGVAILLNLSTPPPALTVVSAASFVQGPLAPDSIATAFGKDLATNAAPYPTTVMVQDSAGATALAQYYYASPSQVNFVIPAATAIGPATVTVTSADGTRSTAQIFIEPIAPTLSTVGSAGIAAAYAIRVSPDNTQTILPVFTAQGNTITPTPLDLSRPGAVYLLLFGTGFDAANAAATVVNIQGIRQTVIYAGPQASFAGFDQIGMLLQPSLAGSGLVSVQVTIGGEPANRVYIAIQ